MRIYDRSLIIGTLIRQLESHFINVDYRLIEIFVDEGIERLLNSCEEVSLTRINNGKDILFSPYDTVQWSVFLYYLSNSLFHANYEESASQVYYLNKILNSVDWFYSVELPKHFFAEHPVGSVFAKAQYGDKFFVFQGVTIGATYDQEGKPRYPVIGNNVMMFANSSILGNSIIGDNVIVSSNTSIYNMTVPSESVVYAKNGNIIIKKQTKDEILTRLQTFWKKS